MTPLFLVVLGLLDKSHPNGWVALSAYLKQI